MDQITDSMAIGANAPVEALVEDASFEVTGRPEREAFVYLLGYPPVQEYLGFAAMSLNAPSQGTLMDNWRAAYAQLGALGILEAGISDGVLVEDLPQALLVRADAISRDAVFQEAYSAMPTSIGMVDLERVIVHQKHINLSHAERVCARMQAMGDVDLVGLCIGSSLPRPPVKVMRVAQNGFSFSSLSNDLRQLDVVLLAPEQVTGRAASGPVSSYVAVPVGYGMNALCVYRVNGRLILGNGMHRAYALLKRGIKLVPAVVQDVTTLEELALVCPPVGANSGPYLSTPRPPLLKDFFNPSLTGAFERPSTVRQVKVVFGSEVIDISA